MRQRIVMTGLAALIIGVAAGPAFAGENDSKPATGKSKLVTVDYVNAEIRDVIRALAAQSGVNLLLNPDVKGQVTVHLRDKSVDEAIVTTANTAGLGAKKLKDTFVIAPRNDMRATLERLGTSRRVTVAHLDPKAAADLATSSFPDLTARPSDKAVNLIGADEDLKGAEELITSRDVAPVEIPRVVEKVALKFMAAAAAAQSVGKIAPGVGVEVAGKDLVLSGPQPVVDAAKSALALIDVKAQPERETRVYTIKYSQPGQLVNLVERMVPDVTVYAGPDSYAPPKPGFSLITNAYASGFTSTNGSASASAGPGGSAMASAGPNAPGGQAAGGQSPNAAAAGSALSLVVSGPPAAVDEAMKILTLTDIAPKQMVIEAKVVETNPSLDEQYGIKYNWDPLNFHEVRAGAPTDPASGALQAISTKNVGPGVFSRTPFSFMATLSAMITKRDAKLLANPQVSVINDQDSSIFIGDTLRYQTLATTSPTTGPTFTVLEVPVGIILLCHPRINTDNEITLHLHPVVSTVTGLVNGLPQTSAREAETVVRVKDGETLVIGGLIRDEDIREMSKIPLLGDLPILGHLFRNTTRQHRRTEVMVVITVHLMK